jgi:capsular polysaccharide transport system permease protein
MTMTTSSPAAAQKPAQVPKPRRFKFLRVTGALVMREIASTDSRTSLGFLWQLIEPVATIFLLSFIFQLMTRKPPLGTNFPLYYVTGVVPFGLFSAVGNKVSLAVRFSKPLLEFPSVSVLDALAARFLLNFLIECAVFVILTMSIIAFYHLHVIINIPLAIESLVLMGGLALGIGTFNSVLFVAFPVYESIYGVVTRPLMLLSGVLFSIESLPAHFRDWLLWNPIANPITLMRAAFYPGVDTSFVSPLYLVLVSLISFTLGLITLRRFFRDALDR